MKNLKESLGRVGVLAGGPSNEREISLRSGKAVYNALIAKGIDTVFLDVGEDVYDVIKKSAIDVAFIVLHARFGEDGTVQSILEELGIPYTGSGVESSRLALDKIAAKRVLAKAGILVPRHIVVDKESCREINTDSIGFPLVVKPHLEGSSIGLSVVRDKKGLADALEKALSFSEKALVEEFIDGRELTVGILNEEPLPVIEIVTKAGVYDYSAKYNDPETRYLVPAPIKVSQSKESQEIGRRSHKALGCSCFSRIDMILNSDGRLFVLEANTIPGMTERSLLPKAAEAIGLNFGDLCITLVKDAVKRGPRGWEGRKR
ncbi:MAG: D-alanine--D-alanine ligase [Candidatus Omnitrophica bacterium]|nr:D-alanine--D-alanine ligase [Candidatus Omnitrophota bacterium]